MKRKAYKSLEEAIRDELHKKSFYKALTRKERRALLRWTAERMRALVDQTLREQRCYIDSAVKWQMPGSTLVELREAIAHLEKLMDRVS